MGAFAVYTVIASGSAPANLTLQERAAWNYAAHCAACHGTHGRGDGPSSKGLNPPPRDFLSGNWRFSKNENSIKAVVKNGIPGTAMASHAYSEEDLDALAKYVKALTKN